MTTLTLGHIKAEHAKLAELIQAFEAQEQQGSGFLFPETVIQLRPGENYAGIVVGKDGEASYHLILMADKPTNQLNWNAAKNWAKRIGGDLPTRREQSLLFANCKEQFDPDWYWSGEVHEKDASYAWGQYFFNGRQYYGHFTDEWRARAVRRSVIE